MSKPSGRTNLASCLVATIFLIFVTTIVLIVFFTVLKPQDPKISVNAVQIPSFAAANGTARLTFSQYAAVSNPNKVSFSHYDSTLRLLHGGAQIGFLFVPAGEIGAGQTQYMTATVSVQPFPIRYGGGAAAEIESRLEMAGRIRVLLFFTHHVEAKAHCVVAVGVSDGSVLSIRC